MKLIIKLLFLLTLFNIALFASLQKKSAVVYYDKDISYSMVGIADYIVVDPKVFNTYRHGFDVYKEKIYPRVDFNSANLDEIQKKTDALLQKGYKNLFFDTSAFLDKKKLIKFITQFHIAFPEVKIMLRAKYDVAKDVASSIYALYVEEYKSQDTQKLLGLGLDVVDVEFDNSNDEATEDILVKEIEAKGFIPYVTNRHFDIYGRSSKNPVKREILTLIDESKVDRMLLSAHQHGALVLEYLGYIQKLYDINKGLPDVEKLHRYAGIIVWLPGTYNDASKFIGWVKDVIHEGIKITFVNNFGTQVDVPLLKQLGIDMTDADTSYQNKKKIIQRDEMIGFETEPSLSATELYFNAKDAIPIYTIEDTKHMRSVPAAIMPWGGYVLPQAFLIEFGDENIWAINPFEFFQKTLRLQPLAVPDTTTENGNRLLFTHIDGDGIMNGVESSSNLFSGDMIYKKILTQYKIPHSVSVIGAEIDNDGLYPKIAKRLQSIAKKFYALPNVEPATHTFTHPFKWGKIDKNGFLPMKYRLKVKNYHFSIKREILGSINEINKNLLPKDATKKAKTVYWSGDCMPRVNALELAYKNHILNINGGYTTIQNSSPWLTLVAPIGLQRGGYYQIYTGAQNENVYTNDWLGPFWGFKKVVQTYKLTNSPRRLKPIDIYYHLYSGSKTASLNALKYVFNWAIKQDVMPIYTSVYIPKAMDYFSVSMAHEGNDWLVAGMKHLKTLRVEQPDTTVDFNNSKTVVGLRHVEKHTYISLDDGTQHLVRLTTKRGKQKRAYLESANGKIVSYQNGLHNQRIIIDAEVDLKLSFHRSDVCKISSIPQETERKVEKERVVLEYKNNKKATITINCK